MIPEETTAKEQAPEILDPATYVKLIALQENIPLGVHVDLTYRCDLACTHCYLETRKRKELTLDEYRPLFAELAALGTLYMLVSGGDIFVRKDALDILRAAAAHRFDITMITHAMAIDDEVADALAEIDIKHVGVSVYHADPEIHDRVTLSKGSHARTLAGIKKLRDRGIPVTMKCPVMAINQGAERVMPAFADTNGTSLKINSTITGGNSGTDVLRELNMDMNGRADVSACNLGHYGDLSEIMIKKPENVTCMAGHSSLYIGPDGVISPCSEFHNTFAGNIREQSLAKIWENAPLFKEMREIRRGSFTGCTTCENFSFCSLCPAHSLRETGSLTGSAPSKCEESQVIRYTFERQNSQSTG